MRAILLLVVLTILPSAMASGKLPKGAYFWSDYNAAKKDAVTNKKPIVFVYTDLNTK